MREDSTKVIFLITDGVQNPKEEGGKVLDPVVSSQNLYDQGYLIFAIGVGEKIDRAELEAITRDPERVFIAKHPNELAGTSFVEEIVNQSCPVAGKSVVGYIGSFLLVYIYVCCEKIEQLIYC